MLKEDAITILKSHGFILTEEEGTSTELTKRMAPKRKEPAIYAFFREEWGESRIRLVAYCGEHHNTDYLNDDLKYVSEKTLLRYLDEAERWSIGWLESEAKWKSRRAQQKLFVWNPVNRKDICGTHPSYPDWEIYMERIENPYLPNTELYLHTLRRYRIKPDGSKELIFEDQGDFRHKLEDEKDIAFYSFWYFVEQLGQKPQNGQLELF